MKPYQTFTMICLFLNATIGWADGNAIDKIYQPYVQPLEREIEWRSGVSEGGDSVHRLGLGKSFSDRLFLELYLIGEDDENFSLSAYELETRWQLTEQGEYAYDWGVLFELEREFDENIWELSSAILIEKQWRRWSSTVNLGLTYEWGSQIDNELESFLAVQTRYRYRSYLEPGLAFYSAEDTLAVGPVLMGDIRFTPGKKLHWESGLYAGLKDETPDTTWRLALEYEF
jgi:hypothetical protein